jgi:hypothetical protein
MSERSWRRAIACLGAAAAFLGVASAESFTTSGKATMAPVQVGGMSADGRPYGANYWTGSTDAVWASGKKTKSTDTCISMSQPPNDSVFMIHVMCEVKDENGTFDAIFGCSPLNRDATSLTCYGGLMGKTGAYQGKRGSMTSYGSAAGTKGSGQWFD